MHAPGLDMDRPDSNMDVKAPFKVDCAPPETNIVEGTHPAANPAGPLVPLAPNFDINHQAEEIDGTNHLRPLRGVPELLSMSSSSVNRQAYHNFIQDQPGDQHGKMQSYSLFESSAHK